MQKLGITVIGLILCVSRIYAQSEKFTIDSLISGLVIKVNNLPLTNTVGQRDFASQSKYTLEWNKRNQTLTVIDERFKPNSTERMPDKYHTKFRIRDIHVDGILIKDIYHEQTLSLQIFTARNANKIKNTIFTNNRQQFSLQQDRLTLGAWDSTKVYSELQEIRNILIEVVESKTKWKVQDRPNMTKNIAGEAMKQTERSSDTPIYLNATIEEPALFEGASNESESQEKVNQYIRNKLKLHSLKFRGHFSGTVVIDTTGAVNSFTSFNMNKPDIEKKAKEIILSMPKWKVGIHKNKRVRTSQVIFLKN